MFFCSVQTSADELCHRLTAKCLLCGEKKLRAEECLKVMTIIYVQQKTKSIANGRTLKSFRLLNGNSLKRRLRLVECEESKTFWNHSKTAFDLCCYFMGNMWVEGVELSNKNSYFPHRCQTTEHRGGERKKKKIVIKDEIFMRFPREIYKWFFFFFFFEAFHVHKEANGRSKHPSVSWVTAREMSKRKHKLQRKKKKNIKQNCKKNLLLRFFFFTVEKNYSQKEKQIKNVKKTKTIEN